MLPSVPNVGIVSCGRLYLGYSLQRVHRAIIKALVSIVSLVAGAYRSDSWWSARVRECRATLGRGICCAEDSGGNVLDEGLNRGKGGTYTREVGFGKTGTALESFPCRCTAQEGESYIQRSTGPPPQDWSTSPIELMSAISLMMEVNTVLLHDY